MHVRTTMLQIDDTNNPSAAEDRHGEECLVAVLGKLIEGLKAGIAISRARYRNRHAMLRYPASDSITDQHLQPAYNIGMRILGGAQHQFVALQHVEQTGVAAYNRGDKFHNPLQYMRQRFGCGAATANLMQEINFGVFS